MVKRTSGTVLLGGERMQGLSPLDNFDLSKGSFFAPTIITDIETTDELWQEEIFGPVIVVKKFSVRWYPYLYLESNSRTYIGSYIQDRERSSTAGE